MTVNYMHQAANANLLTFLRLLFKWRGSIWKSVWEELAYYLILYYIIYFFYKGIMPNTPVEAIFEDTVRYCVTLHSSSSTVLTFVLGFYVSEIYKRWWSVFMMIPWPDSLCFEICAYLRPRSRHYANEDRAVRKSIVRYVCLSFVLTCRQISERVLTRFPTYDHLVPYLMTKDEQTRIEGAIEQRALWLPLEWASLLFKQCYQAKQIDDIHYAKITQTVIDFRERLHNILQYDWVNVPLVYTQVVHICTMSYFLLRVISAQPVPSVGKQPNSILEILPFPTFLIFQFVYFMGWLKVAQVMINPFGMDDDDFDIDSIIERNLIVCYSAVDDMFEKIPKLVDIRNKKLPHNMESLLARQGKSVNPMIGSAAVLEVPKEEQKIVNLPIISEKFVHIPVPEIQVEKKEEPVQPTQPLVASKDLEKPVNEVRVKPSGQVSKENSLRNVAQATKQNSLREDVEDITQKSFSSKQMQNILERLELLEKVQKKRLRLLGEDVRDGEEQETQREEASDYERSRNWRTPEPSRMSQNVSAEKEMITSKPLTVSKTGRETPFDDRTQMSLLSKISVPKRGTSVIRGKPSGLKKSQEKTRLRKSKEVSKASSRNGPSRAEKNSPKGTIARKQCPTPRKRKSVEPPSAGTTERRLQPEKSGVEPNAMGTMSPFQQKLLALAMQQKEREDKERQNESKKSSRNKENKKDSKSSKNKGNNNSFPEILN